MSIDYEELDYRPTPIGDLMLRRRRSPQFKDLDIFEIKLGEFFLMSSLFHEAEEQLAKLGIAETPGDKLDVVVGGLGLGYTTIAALDEERVDKVVVVEYLEGVIDWHRRGLVPLGKAISTDQRCRFEHADFFALARETGSGFDTEYPGRKHDAILLDIDHTPTHVLNQTNTHFYTAEGLAELKTHLKPGGVFALWSDGEPEDWFTEHLAGVFGHAKGHTITFANPVLGGYACGTVYVAKMQK